MQLGARRAKAGVNQGRKTEVCVCVCVCGRVCVRTHICLHRNVRNIWVRDNLSEICRWEKFENFIWAVSTQTRQIIPEM